MSKRPYIPLATKLEACLLLLGLDPKDVEWDHDPALELREVVLVRSDGMRIYNPDANDPRHLVPRSKANHSRKTNGPGGEKRITTRGGDHGDAAHLRALSKKEAEFRSRLLAKAGDGTFQERTSSRKRPVRKIPSRPFAKQRK